MAHNPQFHMFTEDQKKAILITSIISLGYLFFLSFAHRSRVNCFCRDVFVQLKSRKTGFVQLSEGPFLVHSTHLSHSPFLPFSTHDISTLPLIWMLRCQCIPCIVDGWVLVKENPYHFELDISSQICLIASNTMDYVINELFIL